MPEEGINPIPLPDAVRHVWSWFLQLHCARQYGHNGPQPITNSEMLAFFDLECIEPSGWEPLAIRILDRVALEQIYSGSK